MLEDSHVQEARLIGTPQGRVPEGEGWFIVNVADARAMQSDRFGCAARFEGAAEFPDFGINVRVLEPGQPNCLYHRESVPEAFLVLSGECVAIVEEQERPMVKGDFLYAPPGTAHVFVGAGDEPCAILMVGGRSDTLELQYPVSEVAARYGASVEQETDTGKVAYAGMTPPKPCKLPVPW
jgi:uncharacterized cupin superfamily protein